MTVLRQMLRAEIGDALSETAAPDDVSRQSILLSNTQQWLAQRWDWDWLSVRKTVALVGGTHQYDFPSGLTLERTQGRQAVKFGGQRYEVEYGIREADYSLYDSDDTSVQVDPVRKWQMFNVDGALKLEVWPRPASAQTLILRGQRPLNELTEGSHTCDLDDLLIVFFTAAEMRARAGAEDAQAALAKAQSRLNELRATMPAGPDIFILGGATRRDFRPRKYYVVGGTANPSQTGIEGSGGGIFGSSS